MFATAKPAAYFTPNVIAGTVSCQMQILSQASFRKYSFKVMKVVAWK